MLKDLSDIAPKAAVAAVALWAAANYFVIAPQIATRVARADYLPVCEANFKSMMAKVGEERAQSLSMPSLDPAQELAIQQLEAFRSNPLLGQLRDMSGALGVGTSDMLGIERTADFALRQYEDGKRAAKRAYAAAQERIKQETATTLGKAGDVCGCVADAAIAQTLRDWAIFSGTLGFITPAPVQNFDTQMAKAFRGGSCTPDKAGA